MSKTEKIEEVVEGSPAELPKLFKRLEQIQEAIQELEIEKKEIAEKINMILVKYENIVKLDMPDNKHKADKPLKLPNEGSTGYFIIKYLQEQKKGKSIQEIADEVIKMGMPTKSGDVFNLVGSYIYGKKPWFKKTSDGWITTVRV